MCQISQWSLRILEIIWHMTKSGLESTEWQFWRRRGRRKDISLIGIFGYLIIPFLVVPNYQYWSTSQKSWVFFLTQSLESWQLFASKYKIAASHFKCHIISLQKSRAHLKNVAIVSDVQWHHYTAFCQRSRWRMTGSPCHLGSGPSGTHQVTASSFLSCHTTSPQLWAPVLRTTICLDRSRMRDQLLGQENQTSNQLPKDISCF